MTAPVGDVTTPITSGKNGNELFARLVEQAFGGELLLALFQELHQRADAGGLQRVDDDLVFGRAGKVVSLPETMTSRPSSGLIRMRP